MKWEFYLPRIWDFCLPLPWEFYLPQYQEFSLPFPHDDPKKKETKEIIIQVKSGHIGSGMIDALKGVVEKKDAQIGVFITLEEPTKPMMVGAISSGYYRSPLSHNYPKIQILTIEELLEGKKIDYPVRARGIDTTFRKAERYKQKDQQKEMEL